MSKDRGPAAAGKLRSDPPRAGFAVAKVRGQRSEGKKSRGSPE
jgi:hypothetical protein